MPNDVDRHDVGELLTEASAPGTYVVATSSGAIYVVGVGVADSPTVVRLASGSVGEDAGVELPGVTAFRFDPVTGDGWVHWRKQGEPEGYTYTVRTASHVVAIVKTEPAPTVAQSLGLVISRLRAANLYVHETESPGSDMGGSDTGDRITAWCEVCGLEIETTVAEAYVNGWDTGGGGVYPTGLIAPRVCPRCPIEETAWWALAVDRKPPRELLDRQVAAVERIISERHLSPYETHEDTPP